MASTATQAAIDEAVAMHSRQANDFASSYERAGADPYGSCFTYSRMRLERLLNRYLPTDGYGLAVLDIGCGTGHHMQALGARGFEVTGVEPSPEMLKHARTNNPKAHIVQAQADSLPFEDAAFDIAICIEVLRYLPDPETCIEEMARVLRPGGLCLATATPWANANGYAAVNRWAAVMPLPSLTSLKQYFTTVGGFDRRLASAGFDTRRIHGVYTGPINWVQRVAPDDALPGFLRRWERIDDAIADRPRVRNLANMLLVAATRAR
jgi:ubiquinone/menaquinone biosynthesis C-methylase UbiE